MFRSISSLSISLALTTVGFAPFASAQEREYERGRVEVESEDQGMEYEREYEVEQRDREYEVEQRGEAYEHRQESYEGQAIVPHGITQAGPGMTATSFGIMVLGGVGVTGFSDNDVYTFTEPGVQWDFRLIFGSRFVVSGELAYVGSGQNIEALGLDGDAWLLSNGLEGVARLNILPGMIQPYVFAGIGWRFYQIVNAQFNTSALQENDNVGFVPLGVGITLRIMNIIFDARGTFRGGFDSDMFGEDGNMSTWGASVRGGFEF